MKELTNDDIRTVLESCLDTEDTVNGFGRAYKSTKTVATIVTSTFTSLFVFLN